MVIPSLVSTKSLTFYDSDMIMVTEKLCTKNQYLKFTIDAPSASNF
jgi:hypothetical protein